MDVDRHVVTVGGEQGRPAAEGVRPAGDAAAQRGPGAHPDAADRPGLGRRLRRRHQDARRARQAAAGEDRAGPGQRRATSSRCAGSATSSSRRPAVRGTGAGRRWRPRRWPGVPDTGGGHAGVAGPAWWPRNGGGPPRRDGGHQGRPRRWRAPLRHGVRAWRTPTAARWPTRRPCSARWRRERWTAGEGGCRGTGSP